MIEYTLTMNSAQAHETLKAVELLMRLKINQSKEISRAVMPEDYWQDDKLDKEMFNDYLTRRDAANRHMEMAFNYIFPSWEDAKKDEEWYRLYNIYQALRYQIHLAEHPDSTGVDSYPPTQFTEEPIPKCTWAEKEDG